MKIFTLPTYSPEYNPVEQVWKWLKNTSLLPAESHEWGSKEIVFRIRKIIRAWVLGKLSASPKIGIGRGKIYYSNIMTIRLIYNRE